MFLRGLLLNLCVHSTHAPSVSVLLTPALVFTEKILLLSPDKLAVLLSCLLSHSTSFLLARGPFKAWIFSWWQGQPHVVSSGVGPCGCHDFIGLLQGFIFSFSTELRVFGKLPAGLIFSSAPLLGINFWFYCTVIRASGSSNWNILKICDFQDVLFGPGSDLMPQLNYPRKI